jgi:hypothetical protein
MGIIIRDADLIQDKDVLINTLNQNRVRKTDERRYRWLYLENPFGKAKAWLAVDDQKGKVAGFTSVFPRLMHVCGEEMVCWNCGDFSINQRYRTLGVAIQLRLAATGGVNRGEVPFLYAHPNDRMKIVHLKAGHKVIGQMARYARPLSIDRYLPSFLKGFPRLSDGLRWIYNGGLSAWNGPLGSSRSFHSENYDGFPATAPFNSLLEQARRRLKIFGQRNDEYLNWRFGINPLVQVHTLLLYESGELVGYAFYSYKDEIMYINDLFCLPEQEVSDALVARLTEIGFDQKAQAVSVTLLESNPLIQSLRRSGYRLRPESSSVIVHTSPEVPWGAMLQDKTNWFMTVGDRDV